MKVEDWNGHPIRFVEKDGEWWAIAQDVAKAMLFPDIPEHLNNTEYLVRFVEHNGEWEAITDDLAKCLGYDEIGIITWEGYPIRVAVKDGKYTYLCNDADYAVMRYEGYVPLTEFLQEGEWIESDLKDDKGTIALTNHKRLIYITHWYGNSNLVKIPNIVREVKDIIKENYHREALIKDLARNESIHLDDAVELPEIVKKLYSLLGIQYGEFRNATAKAIHEKVHIDYSNSGVYLVRADNGLTKIGCSRNMPKRFESLKTASPCQLRLVGVYPCKNYTEEEWKLHQQFADKRVQGEWFQLDNSDLMALNEKFHLGLSVSEQIYKKYAAAQTIGKSA